MTISIQTRDWRMTKRRETLQPELAGPPIPDGSRNVTLTRIAGRLHNGTRTLAELTEDLHAVNKSRCEPPVSRREAEGIAKSIHPRPACIPSKGRPPVEVLDFVRRHWIGVVSAEPWKGHAGGSNYKVYEALLEVAERHGWLSESGNVCVSVSIRDLAMLAGVSNPTCINALKRLQGQRLLYRVPMPTRGKAGRLVLRDVSNALPPGLTSQSTNVEPMLSGKGLSELLTALKRFRPGAGSITPTMMLYVRCLLFLKEGADLGQVSRILQRRPDNVRRSLRALKERRIVEEMSRDFWRVSTDLLANMEMALIEDGIPDTERAQRRRNDNDREAYERYRTDSREVRMETLARECEDHTDAEPEPQASKREGETVDQSPAPAKFPRKPYRLVVEGLPVEAPEGLTYEQWEDYKRETAEMEKRWKLREVTPEAPQRPVRVVKGGPRGKAPAASSKTPPAAPELVQSPTASLKTGSEIVLEFAEADGHSLGCDCNLCSVTTPRYVTATVHGDVTGLARPHNQEAA